jgi:hypothetical protein
MKKIITLFMFMTCLNVFASNSFSFGPTDSDNYEKGTIPNLEQILNQSETEAATVAGLKVLQTARAMISNQEIITGSCWDYADGVYNEAGYPDAKRLTIFRSKLQGPYLDQGNSIQGGDWLYFINHSYGDVEHSAIFVAWTNLEKKEALMISYAGGDQKIPARYKIYDLSSVYNIMRGH